MLRCVSTHYFLVICVCKRFTHISTHICNTHIQMHVSPESCPCLFSDFSNLRWCRGKWVKRDSICVLRFLSRSPGFLFRVFIKLKSWTTHNFPPRTWQRTEKNRKANKGKRLSNYFKQHTKLKHCAEPSKGQHPECCGFPAVWGEGNAKGIFVELTLKGEIERGIGWGKKERERPNESIRLSTDFLMNWRALLHLMGSMWGPFSDSTPQPQSIALSIANKQTQCSFRAVIHRSGSLNVVHAALQTDLGSEILTLAPTLTSTC